MPQEKKEYFLLLIVIGEGAFLNIYLWTAWVLKLDQMETCLQRIGTSSGWRLVNRWDNSHQQMPKMASPVIFKCDTTDAKFMQTLLSVFSEDGQALYELQTLVTVPGLNWTFSQLQPLHRRNMRKAKFLVFLFLLKAILISFSSATHLVLFNNCLTDTSTQFSWNVAYPEWF